MAKKPARKKLNGLAKLRTFVNKKTKAAKNKRDKLQRDLKAAQKILNAKVKIARKLYTKRKK